MKYTKEEIEKYLFEDKLSYEEIGRKYGIVGASVKKAAKKLGILLPTRRVLPEGYKPHNAGTLKQVYCVSCNKNITNTFSKKFCSKECQHAEKYNEYLISNGDNTQYYHSVIFKSDFLKEQDNKCDICKIDNVWNGKLLIFVLDHIDGKASNNKRDNLRLICHNCDSQLDTYKSKNKNSDRKDRYLLNYKN